MIIPLDGVHLKIDKRNNNYIQHLTSQKQQLYTVLDAGRGCVLKSVMYFTCLHYSLFYREQVKVLKVFMYQLGVLYIKAREFQIVEPFAN